jgi:hypothetical protein
MTLEPGLERTEEFTAEGRLLTDVRGMTAEPALRSQVGHIGPA